MVVVGMAIVGVGVWLKRRKSSTSGDDTYNEATEGGTEGGTEGAYGGSQSSTDPATPADASQTYGDIDSMTSYL